MQVLLGIMRVALVTHKTIAAVAASIVITTGVIEYLRNQKRKKP